MDLNLGNFMQKAKEIQSNIASVKTKLDSTFVNGESGGGLISVQMNCNYKMTKIEIAPEVEGDKKMMEDLIVAAVNNAIIKAKETNEEEFKNATGGMPNIPGFNF